MRARGFSRLSIWLTLPTAEAGDSRYLSLAFLADALTGSPRPEADVAELADATDSKSVVPQRTCGFDPLRRHREKCHKPKNATNEEGPRWLAVPFLCVNLWTFSLSFLRRLRVLRIRRPIFPVAARRGVRRMIVFSMDPPWSPWLSASAV
jgi:hypothetical protein